MFGLGDPLGLKLSIDSIVQRVGDTPTYTLIGAPPGATIYWSSYKDGESTGEFNSSYGQVVEANGTAQIAAGGPWTDANIGVWIKEVLVQDADGNNHTAMVQFRVVPAAAEAGSPSPAPGSFWDNPLFYVGDLAVTPVVAGVAAIGLYFLTKKR